jgi:hypothetical protein
MSKRIAGNGGSSTFGGLRSPMAASENSHKGMKVNLKPSIASNTMRPEIKTGAARVRSAQTAGEVVKPW